MSKLILLLQLLILNKAERILMVNDGQDMDHMNKIKERYSDDIIKFINNLEHRRNTSNARTKVSQAYDDFRSEFKGPFVQFGYLTYLKFTHDPINNQNIIEAAFYSEGIYHYFKQNLEHIFDLDSKEGIIEQIVSRYWDNIVQLKPELVGLDGQTPFDGIEAVLHQMRDADPLLQNN